jgi:hypothetical protein
MELADQPKIDDEDRVSPSMLVEGRIRAHCQAPGIASICCSPPLSVGDLAPSLLRRGTWYALDPRMAFASAV